MRIAALTLDFTNIKLMIRDIAEEKECGTKRIREKLMKLNDSVRDDIQLVALMIARLLRTEHGIEPAPRPSDYKIVDEGLKPHGCGDLQVRINIARGVSINVRHIWHKDDIRNLETLIETAEEMARFIGSVLDPRAEILKMMEEVKCAARREISKARRRGLPYRLLSVEPSEVLVRHDEGMYITVGVEILGENLRPRCLTFDVDSAEVACEMLKGLNEEQSSRAVIRAALASKGATGVIDPVVVNALRDAGHNVANVLARLGIFDDSFIDVGEDEENSFRLYWRDGRVFSTIKLAEGVTWSEGHLSFRQLPFASEGLNGRPVREVFPNQVFGDDVRIKAMVGEEGGHAILNCTGPMLHFDSDTGRMWAA